MTVQILPIEPGSDGDGRKWPKHHYNRNDAYFLERVGGMWIKDLPGGPQPGTTYRLDQMPSGYAGFEKVRAGKQHIDRYVYGHPNGQFRSLNEFYPHFKHLMDVGGSAGCGCVKCAGTARKVKDPPERRSRYFAQPSSGSAPPAAGDLISPLRVAGTLKKGRYASSDDELPRRRDVDPEGTPDVYEKLIDQLKEAGPDGLVDEAIAEKMSPDWRAGDSKLTETLKATRSLPAFAPRIGELVLFVRKHDAGQRLAWDKCSQSFKRLDVKTNTWREAPKWEAGVVTQMPQEDIDEQDLVGESHKEQSIIYSGFKIEPLPEPGNEAKPHTRQHKHVPLHAIRPFALWQDCLRIIPQAEWHPTIKHALTVSSSFCCVGRYRFTGTWPNASVYCRGLYLGPELILLGDTVRLSPRSGSQCGSTVTEIMTITAIRLRFVNLDFDEDDLAPSAPAIPYQTSLHVTGKIFTTDPSRSFNGVSKKSIEPQTGSVPPEMDKYGPWHHYTDPNNPSARVEIPFSRITGRCCEYAARSTLFTAPPDVKTEMQPPAFEPVNAPKDGIGTPNGSVNLLSRGLTATKEARAYSQEHDTRLTSTEQLWFWADTRIAQLDLHEVNGRFVGARDAMRSKEQLSRWQKALKALNGKKGALEEYEAARKQLLEEERAVLRSTGDLMGTAAVDTEMESSRNGDSGDVAEKEEEVEEEEEKADVDAMEVDDPLDASTSGQSGAGSAPPTGTQRVTIDLMDSEDEEELAKDQLVGELFKGIRSGGGRV